MIWPTMAVTVSPSPGRFGMARLLTAATAFLLVLSACRPETTVGPPIRSASPAMSMQGQNATVIDLGAIPNYASNVARSINASGRSVGYGEGGSPPPGRPNHMGSAFNPA